MIAPLLTKRSKNRTVKAIHDVHHQHKVDLPKRNIEGGQ